jgi:hypothetical protein
MAAALRRLTEVVRVMLVEDYAKVDKRMPHLLDRLRERGADYCWHKASLVNRLPGAPPAVPSRL